jgi:hypothetical protein
VLDEALSSVPITVLLLYNSEEQERANYDADFYNEQVENGSIFVNAAVDASRLPSSLGSIQRKSLAWSVAHSRNGRAGTPVTSSIVGETRSQQATRERGESFAFPERRMALWMSIACEMRIGTARKVSRVPVRMVTSL